MRRTVLILFVLLALSSSLFSQKGVIKGKLLDTVYKESLAEATISILLPQDSSVVAFALANAKGEFEINNVDTGRFQILVTFQGYANYYRPVHLRTLSTVDVGSLYLEKKSTMLEEVVVEIPPIQVKKDTIEFNATAFKTKPNSTAEDLLKKIPGLEVDKDGNVKAQGEDIRKIYVDGKEFFGNDPKLATKNITADMIASVQVFDDMSDQAKFSRIDDGSRAKTINIKLKKDRRKGYFGRGTVGIGSDDRYLANISANRFNEAQRISVVANFNNLNRQGFSSEVTPIGGNYRPPANQAMGNNGGITRTSSLGVNYTDKIGSKVEIAASYHFSESDVRTSQLSARQTFFPDDSTTYQTSLSESRNKESNHRFNMKLEYYIDSMNSILYTPNLGFQQGERSSLANTNTLTGTGINQYKVLSGTNQNSNKREGLNLNNNILYRRKFRKFGRTLTLGWNNSINNNDIDGSNYFPLTFYKPDGSVDNIRNRDFKSSQQTRSNNSVLSSSFTEPIGKNKILELNYAYTDNNSISDREAMNFNPITKEYDSLNPQQTNYFENDFIAHRVGMNFRIQNPKYGFQVGGAVQNSTLDNKSIRAIYRVDGKDSIVLYNQNFTNFFPTANFNYAFSRNKNLRFSYRGRTNQPGVTQLQDVRDETNALRTIVGNPNLNQEFNNNFNASYNTFNPGTSRFFNVNINYSQVSNRIVNSIGLDSVRGRGVQLIRPVNLNGSFNANSSINYGIPLRKKMKGSSINFSNSVNYNRDVSLLYEQKNITNSYTIRQKIGVNMDFREKLNFRVDASVAYHNVVYSGGQAGTSVIKQQNTDNEYLTQMYSTDINYFITKALMISTDFDYLVNSGRAEGFNQGIPVWNADIAYQLFAKKNGEIKFSVNDIPNQNKSINRNVGDNFIEDTRTTVLTRYFLLTFTYNLNRAGVQKTMKREFRGEMRD